MLEPMARLMIDHAVDLPQVIEELKKALVHQALNRYALEGKEPSDARASLLTGVHRKDVRRLRQASDNVAGTKAGLSTSAAVVARWISDPAFLHFDQTPLRLARTPRHADSGQPDFSALVARVSKDTSARTVLDELLRLGAVSIDGDTHLTLNRTAFIPQQDSQGKFHFLATAVRDHFQAAVSNVATTEQPIPMLDQSAFSDGLDARQAALLHAKARTLWTQALQKFLADATVAEQRSLETPGPRYRVRFGSYFLEEVQAAPASDAKTRKPRASKKAGKP